jgi:hypothetical protein
LRLAEDEGGLVNFLHEWLQLDRLFMDVEAALIRACEGEQALHQIGHPPHFLQRFLESNHPLGLIHRHHRPLDIGTQHGEGRLELVARVGGKSPQRTERSLEPRDHRVERRDQIGEVAALLTEREPAVQAAAIGDRRHFRCYLRQLPLGVTKENEGNRTRREHDDRYDDERIEDVLARNRRRASGDSARCDSGDTARRLGHRM